MSRPTEKSSLLCHSLKRPMIVNQYDQTVMATNPATTDTDLRRSFCPDICELEFSICIVETLLQAPDFIITYFCLCFSAAGVRCCCPKQSTQATLCQYTGFDGHCEAQRTLQQAPKSRFSHGRSSRNPSRPYASEQP